MQKTIPSVSIISAIMGTGKTEATINYVEGLPPDKKIIVAALYKDEINRYEDCTNFKLKQPVNPKSDEGGKLEFFKKLLEKGSNIVTSHELLKRCGDEEIELIESQGYELILDESPTCYAKYKPEDIDEPYYKGLPSSTVKMLRAQRKMTAKQIEDFVSECTTEDPETHLLYWRKDESGRDVPPGRYVQEQKLVKQHRLVHNAYGRLLIIFPVDVLKAFSHIKVMTYMFNNSELRCYLNQFGFKTYSNFITDDMTITVDYRERARPNKYDDEDEEVFNPYKDLIQIWTPATNKKKEKHFVGEGKCDLSSRYYKQRATPDDLASIGSDLSNWLNNAFDKPVKKNDFFYSTFKVGYDSKDRNIWRDVKSRNANKYKKSHVAINERATNEYRECTKVAFLGNIYMDVEVKEYLVSMGLIKDDKKEIEKFDNAFAVSTLLQVVFRSAIREKKPIDLYLPSSRMRDLLTSWLTYDYEEYPHDFPYT